MKQLSAIPDILQPFPKRVLGNSFLECQAEKELFGELYFRQSEYLAKDVTCVLYEKSRPLFLSDDLPASGHGIAVSNEDATGGNQGDHCCVDQRLHDFGLGGMDDIQGITGFQFLEQELHAPSTSVEVCDLLSIECFEGKVGQIQMIFLSFLVHDANQSHNQGNLYIGTSISTSGNLNLHHDIENLSFQRGQTAANTLSYEFDGPSATALIDRNDLGIGVPVQSRDEVPTQSQDALKLGIPEESQIEEQQTVLDPVAKLESFDFGLLAGINGHSMQIVRRDRQNRGYFDSSRHSGPGEGLCQRVQQPHDGAVDDQHVLEGVEHFPGKLRTDRVGQEVLEDLLQKEDQPIIEPIKKGGRSQRLSRDRAEPLSQSREASFHRGAEAENKVPEEDRGIDLLDSFNPLGFFCCFPDELRRQGAGDGGYPLRQGGFGINMGPTRHAFSPGGNFLQKPWRPMFVQGRFLTGSLGKPHERRVF